MAAFQYPTQKIQPAAIFPANLYEEYGVDWRATETPEKIAQVEANPRFIPNPEAQARGKKLMEQQTKKQPTSLKVAN
jgi:hypothetical protein